MFPSLIQLISIQVLQIIKKKMVRLEIKNKRRLDWEGDIFHDALTSIIIVKQNTKALLINLLNLRKGESHVGC